jgi:hypothetical protein
VISGTVRYICTCPRLCLLHVTHLPFKASEKRRPLHTSCAPVCFPKVLSPKWMSVPPSVLKKEEAFVACPARLLHQKSLLGGPVRSSCPLQSYHLQPICPGLVLRLLYRALFPLHQHVCASAVVPKGYCEKPTSGSVFPSPSGHEFSFFISSSEYSWGLFY